MSNTYESLQNEIILISFDTCKCKIKSVLCLTNESPSTNYFCCPVLHNRILKRWCGRDGIFKTLAAASFSLFKECLHTQIQFTFCLSIIKLITHLHLTWGSLHFLFYLSPQGCHGTFLVIQISRFLHCLLLTNQFIMLLAGFKHILQSIMALQPTKKLLWIMRKWMLLQGFINWNMTHFKLISDYITTITQSINQCNNLCEWRLEAHVFHIDEYIIL